MTIRYFPGENSRRWLIHPVPQNSIITLIEALRTDSRFVEISPGRWALRSKRRRRSAPGTKEVK